MSMVKTRWHPQYEACQGCERIDRPHIAKVYCETCYRKARAAERRQAEARGEQFAAPSRNIWHLDHAYCLGCGGTIRPHLADGLCVACYRARYVPGDRGHEELPRYQPGRDQPTPINALTPLGGVGSDPATVVDLASRRAATPSSTPPAPAVQGSPCEVPTGRVTAPAGIDRSHQSKGPSPDAADQVPVAAPPAAPVAAHHPAPRLYPRHIRLIRTYAITCPNCGDAVRNTQTGGDTFAEREIPPGTEIACICCGARWGITLE